MSTLDTLRHRTNKQLASINREYHNQIPLGEIFTIVYEYIGQVIDIDGTPWQGILLGDNSNTTFAIADSKIRLHLSWYKMPSGRFEITAYVS